jgi:dihydrofolate reductase
MIATIAAVDDDWGIGAQGELLHRCREDLAEFKRLTIGHSILCGKVTAAEMGLLPQRTIHTVSQVHRELSRAYLESLIGESGKLFICGGQSIYEQTLHLSDVVYLSRLKCPVRAADRVFPKDILLSMFEHVIVQDTPTVTFEVWTLKRNAIVDLRAI